MKSLCNQIITYPKKQVECDTCGRVTEIPKVYRLCDSCCKECGSVKIRLHRPHRKLDRSGATGLQSEGE